MSLDPCELCSVGVRKLSGTAALRLRLKSLARARSFHLLGCATTDAKTCRNISAGLRHSSRASPSVSWRPYYIVLRTKQTTAPTRHHANKQGAFGSVWSVQSSVQSGWKKKKTDRCGQLLRTAGGACLCACVRVCACVCSVCKSKRGSVQVAAGSLPHIRQRLEKRWLQGRKTRKTCLQGGRSAKSYSQAC